jgi:hypothetical protein
MLQNSAIANDFLRVLQFPPPIKLTATTTEILLSECLLFNANSAIFGYQKMAITLGPVTCGPKPFGIYFHFLASSMH